MERPYGIHPFRAAGSAGGRFPLELYVAVPPGGPLPAACTVRPVDHALVQVGPPPRARRPGQLPAVVVTGVPWRTGWRYRERGYRHVYWDAGTMLAQLLALADSAGLPARLYTVFPMRVAALIGADRVHELPVAVVAWTRPLLPSTRRPGGARGRGLRAARVPAGYRGPAGRGMRPARPCRGNGAAGCRCRPVPAPVEYVIAARGSQRRMDASRGLSGDLLRTGMGVAVRGLGLPHWIVVHDVTGLPPGVYRWPDLDAPVRAGVLRDELYRVCLDQALARDAAFVAIAARRLGRPRRPRIPCGAPGRRAGRRPAAPGRLRPRRQRIRDDLADSQTPASSASPWTACCPPASASPCTRTLLPPRPAPQPPSARSSPAS